MSAKWRETVFLWKDGKKVNTTRKPLLSLYIEMAESLQRASVKATESCIITRIHAITSMNFLGR